MAEKKEEAKSAKKEDAKPAAGAPAKGGKKSRIVMAAAAVVVLGAGGGGAWWYTQLDADGAAEEVKVKAAPVLPPVFVALEPFTVNLQPEAVGSQYMQIGITLKIAGQAMADKLKEQMPEVRSRLLMALSAKKASELLLPEGKIRLVQELLMEVTQILDPAAAKKPAAPVNVAAAATGTRTDAADTPEGEPPAEDAAAEAASADTAAGTAGTGPVLSVLFTSFIIQ